MIAEGRTEVVRAGRRLAELGPGHFFGEIGLLVRDDEQPPCLPVTMRLIAMFEPSCRRLERELPVFADSVRAAAAARFPLALGAPGHRRSLREVLLPLPAGEIASGRDPGG